jgi:hypothetical protein
MLTALNLEREACEDSELVAGSDDPSDRLECLESSD